MITINNDHNDIPTLREKILEKRIEILQERIHQLETKIFLKSSTPKFDERNKIKKNKPSFLVLPVTYTPEQERSPTLEIVSSSPMDDFNNHLLLVEQLNSRTYETIV
jgi:hypothetical protein